LGFSLSLRKYACHVQQRGNTYYFRLNVPSDLRHIFDKREMKYTLGRIPLQDARTLGNAIASIIKLNFKRIRNGHMSDLSENEIATIVEEEVRELLTVDQRKRVTEKESVAEKGSDPEENKEKFGLRGFEWIFPPSQKSLESNIEQNQWNEQVKWAANDIIQKREMNITEDSWEYNYFCFALCNAMWWFNQIGSKRDIGIYNSQLEDMSLVDDIVPGMKSRDSQSNQNANEKTGTPQSQEQTTQVRKVHTLSEIIDAWLSEGEWDQKTYNEYRASLKLLERVIGNKPVDQIERLTIKEYKDTLRQLPPNLNKHKKYKNKSIQDVIALVDKPMSTTTINKNLIRASQCFGWAVRNGYLGENPAENMTIDNKVRPRDQRNIFTTEDLVKIFHSKEYVNDSFKHSYQFWLPVIGLFTGMRIEEICQLHLEDICLVQGVWVFDLFEKHDDKRKTEAGQRYVPLHPFLRDDLNLPGWIKHLENKGYTKLFPELKKNNLGKYSHYPSRWFNDQFKKKLHLDNIEKKAFHSFRHTFTNHLKQKGVDYFVLAELIGHEIPGETLNRYGKNYEPKVLFDKVMKHIDYEGLGLDLSHLKKCKFTVNNQE